VTDKKKLYKKIALTLSLCAIIVWAVLGTGASIAWFTDTTPVVKNIFHIADFQLVVSHRLADGTYEVMDGETQVFDDEALYEPGYVQVVYLKVENKGDIPFDFYSSVMVTDYTLARNVFGSDFELQDYLRFGVVTAETEAELESKVGTRAEAKAQAYADMPLSRYDTDKAELGAGETAYVALVVRMPEEVGNEANYRGSTIPRVELGVIVKASQQTD